MTMPHPTRADFLAYGWPPEHADELDAVARDLERREAIRDDKHADYLQDLAAHLRGELDTPPN